MMLNFLKALKKYKEGLLQDDLEVETIGTKYLLLMFQIKFWLKCVAN